MTFDAVLEAERRGENKRGDEKEKDKEKEIREVR